jgi:hypothetical protein
MIVRENLSSVITSIGKNNYTPINDLPMGMVFGVITTENTPTKAAFEKAGGFSGIGKVFYLNYPISKNVNTGSLNDDFYLNKCGIAKPQFSNQHYPLLKEIINLSSLASPATQDSDSTSGMYYTVLNLWNNTQQNAQLSNDNDSLGISYLENPNTKPLLPFMGDTQLKGRQGSSLRFSTTTKIYNDLNEWSAVGNDDDPITILSNGHAYDPNKDYYVEQINKDASSIYLTSAQKIPLQTDKTGVLNNLTNPLNVPDYFNSQTIINSDRVVLNSKKDEVMIFAKTNIELNTKNTINLNADERIHLNSNAIFLGPYNSTNTPQPLVLGNQLYTVLSDILDSLHSLGISLSSIVGSPEGAPAIDINMAAEDLLNSVEKVSDNLESILSNQNFTV